MSPLRTDIEYPDEMHRIPMDDLREHEVSGGCWCKPHLEVDECDEHGVHFRWYHRALDGRDYYADGRVTLQ